MLSRVLFLILILVAFASRVRADAPPPVSPSAPILGDYDAELRTPDGHFDVDRNLTALKKLGVNTYFYLIWHSPFDWDDLPGFARAADRAGIQVWVYVIPWSETRKKWGASKPFETDFVRWAQEIAKLSLEHKNIVGYAIDDFYVNARQPDRFTRKYVRRMVEAGRAINPKIKFYPLAYTQQDWGDFVDRFAELIDGVVAAYPQSSLEIDRVLKYLHGEVTGFAVLIDMPKASKGGVKAFVSRDLTVRDPDKCAMSFYWDAGDHMGTKLNHRIGFVKVAGETVWKADANAEKRDDFVTIDLSRQARGKQSLRIELGAGDEQALEQYPVAVKFDDVRFTGLDSGGDVPPRKLWKPTEAGGFQATVSDPPLPMRRGPIPLILMPAGDQYSHKLRYGQDDPTGRYIARMVRLCLAALKERKVEGVVLYCLPKEAGNAIFDAIVEEYQKWKQDNPPEGKQTDGSTQKPEVRSP